MNNRNKPAFLYFEFKLLPHKRIQYELIDILLINNKVGQQLFLGVDPWMYKTMYNSSPEERNIHFPS